MAGSLRHIGPTDLLRGVLRGSYKKDMGARRPRFVFVVLVLGLAALMLYPLSLGPVYWACSDGQGRLHVEEPAVELLLELYSPLVWVHQQGPPPLRNTLQWYLTLWGAP